MKNSQALRENRTLGRGNGQAAESRQKACRQAGEGKNKEISTVKYKSHRPEIRIDGKYLRGVLVDPRNGHVAKVTARKKLVAGRECEILGLEPGNSDWSVYVRAIKIPVKLHRELVADMEKALRRKGKNREVDALGPD